MNSSRMFKRQRFIGVLSYQRVWLLSRMANTELQNKRTRRMPAPTAQPLAMAQLGFLARRAAGPAPPRFRT